jgi:hypothetical protein
MILSGMLVATSIVIRPLGASKSIVTGSINFSPDSRLMLDRLGWKIASSIWKFQVHYSHCHESIWHDAYPHGAILAQRKTKNLWKHKSFHTGYYLFPRNHPLRTHTRGV